MGSADAEQRAQFRQLIDKIFEVDRLLHPAGSPGTLSELAHNWETAGEDEKRDFLDCLIEGLKEFVQAFLDLPEETKNLIRRRFVDGLPQLL